MQKERSNNDWVTNKQFLESHTQVKQIVAKHGEDPTEATDLS